MKYQVLLVILFFGLNLAHAQTSLNGKVIDGDSNEPILFGSVALYKDGSLLTGSETDLDGFYNFANIDPGTYDVEVSYIGFKSKRVIGVVVYGGQANNLDVSLGLGSGTNPEEVEVINFKVPLIKQTDHHHHYETDRIKKLPPRTIDSLKKN